MSDALLAADSICKRFGTRAVLQSASVWARPGRITALVGRNGTGKSTLLRIAAGLLSADNGAVHFAGRCWERPRLARLARDGLFFLPPEDLLPWHLTVGDSLQWMAAAWGSVRKESAIEQLRLGPLLDEHPYRLSGGERRRADLAAVLTRGPRCLLADEPFLGLAPLDAELLSATLRGLAAEGCAILVSGHEVATLLDLADEVVWLTDGTTRVLGAPAEAQRNDYFRRDYLGWALT